jgi:hypothetical protein
MTELQRARTHLQNCQLTLARDRRCNYSWAPLSERNVLAALSWVWEEQCADERDHPSMRMVAVTMICNHD